MAKKESAKSRTFQNFMLAHKEGTGCAYYGRKSAKGVKASVVLKLKKYDKKLRKHVVFTQKKIVYKSN